MKDCVTDYFNNMGFETEQDTLGNSDIVLGIKLEFQGSLFTYKVDKDTLMIICYERINSKNTGLRSGFKDLLNWLKIIKNNTPIKWVTGRVDALSSAPSVSGLTTDKLNRFYRDIMQTPDARDLGEKWFRFDIDVLHDFRHHYKLMKQGASS